MVQIKRQFYQSIRKQQRDSVKKHDQEITQIQMIKIMYALWRCTYTRSISPLSAENFKWKQCLNFKLHAVLRSSVMKSRVAGAM